MTVIRSPHTVRRVLVAGATALAIVPAAAGSASAAPPSSPEASCVATITAYEATQLAPGSVGSEVSGLARISPGFAGALVSPLAHEHGGSIPACA